MANKNQKQVRAVLAKAKGDVVAQGQNGKYTIPWGYQKRLSNRPKVACLTGKKQVPIVELEEE